MGIMFNSETSLATENEKDAQRYTTPAIPQNVEINLLINKTKIYRNENK